VATALFVRYAAVLEKAKIFMRKLAISLISVVLGYGILLMLPVYGPVKTIPFYQNQSFSNIAHGAGRELLPGNTLEAAVNAVAVGADVIELDVHLTKDNVVVLRHDATIDSTTNGSGNIAEMTLAELQEYEVGFHKEDYPDKTAPAGIRISTLESLFEALPGERFLIELKPNDDATGEALCQLVTQHNKVNQVLVGSFHTNVLERFRKICPEIPTSLGETEARTFVVLAWLGLAHLYNSPGYSVQLPAELNGTKVITKSLVNVSKRLNLNVDVWTVNDPNTMRELMQMGVSGIITDRPDVLQAIIKENTN
jgi:glycerophosphoryl diester phosphodiesterase